jgi:hypothetical protein
VPTTPIYALPYQSLADAPDGPHLGADLALAVEGQLARIDAAVASNVINIDANTTAIGLNTTALNNLTGAWTDWTVAWTAATTNPVLGNGLRSGRYKQIGKLTFFWWTIQGGTTTTWGTGQYAFSFPLGLAAIGPSGAATIGVGMRDSSGATQTTGFGSYADGATVCDIRAVNTNPVSPTVPWTWASGDYFHSWGWIESL